MNGSQRLRFLTIIPAINANFNDVCRIQAIRPQILGLYPPALLDGGIGNSFISHGYSRSVMIKSHGANLAGATFTITGFQNGAPVTATFNGPNANLTVDSVVVFDTITSILFAGAGLSGREFSATGGEIAYTRPLFVNWSNPNTNLMSYGLSVRNTAARDHAVFAAQVFTAGVSFEVQTNNQEKYGLFVLEDNTNTSYIYRGLPAPLVDGTSVAYPLWDAFIVVVHFVVDDDPEPAVIVFPQIGR